MKNNPQAIAGFTIIEVITAVITTSILITIIFTTWNYISTTTARRQRYTALQSECSRVTQMVTDAVQKAEAVLRYDRNSIWLLGVNASDTTVYMYDGSAISRNGTPVHFIIPGVQVSEFRFENVHGYRDEKPYLFDFHCTLFTLQGDTAAIQTTVMGRRPRDNAMRSGGSDFMW